MAVVVFVQVTSHCASTCILVQPFYIPIWTCGGNVTDSVKLLLSKANILTFI